MNFFCSFLFRLLNLQKKTDLHRRVQLSILKIENLSIFHVILMDFDYFIYRIPFAK